MFLLFEYACLHTQIKLHKQLKIKPYTSLNDLLLLAFTISDDGKLSFEEFKAYFADGVLSGEELHELFHTIDTHNTK